MKCICTNCMGFSELLSCPVGPYQRDQYQEQLLLCGTCLRSLVAGRLSEFHDRFGSEVTVTRKDLEPHKKDNDGRVT